MKPIQFKRSCISGVKPTSCELEEGEIALNLADKIAYSKDCDGDVIEIGGSPEEINGGLYGGSGSCNSRSATICLSSEITLPATLGSSTGVPIYTNSGKYFNAGDLITVSARGCATFQNLSDKNDTGPDGMAPGRGVTRGNWMVLVGVLDFRNTTTISGSEVTGEFAVGSYYSQPAASSGYLYLGIFDELDFRDNGGNYCALVSGGTSTPTTFIPTTTNPTQPTVTITSQPADSTAVNGVVYCSVVATASSGTLTYGWQWYNDGIGWVPMSDAALSALPNAPPPMWSSASGSSTAILTINGLTNALQFRCVVATATANPVVSLICTKRPQAATGAITITQQPTSMQAMANGTGFAVVVATATSGTLAYKWQWLNGTNLWIDLPSGNSSGGGPWARVFTGAGELWVHGVVGAVHFRCLLSTATASATSNMAIISA